MKAQFEICVVEEPDLVAFEYGLKSLIVQLGGGSFQKSRGRTSNDIKYDYECDSNDVRLTMNLVGTLAARHRLIENMQRHTLL
jgi:hypothetical protein